MVGGRREREREIEREKMITLVGGRRGGAGACVRRGNRAAGTITRAP